MMNNRRFQIVLGLAAFAFVLRLAYLLLAANHLGMAKFWNWAPDTNTYWAAASILLGEHDPIGDWALFRVGPGYAAILAVIRLVFGNNPIFPIVFSLLMGTLAPVAVFLLAYNLIKQRAVAATAGVLAAISPVAVSLSCHILTDQTFFTLQCFALVFFVRALERRELKWYIYAGLTCGVGLLVRPSGQMWPYLFFLLPLILPLPRAYYSRFDLWKRAAVCGALALLISLSWMTRNYAVEGVFTFGTNSVITARDCVLAQVESELTGRQIYDLRHQWSGEDHDRTPPLGEAYLLAKQRVATGYREHPDLVMKYYLRNLEENVTASNFYWELQLPVFVGTIRAYNHHFVKWGGYLMLVLTLGGLVWLGFRRLYTALILLGVTWFYFTLPIGFSFWQGSRLHLSAEMAGNILVAFVLVSTVSAVKRLLRRLG